MQSLLNNLARGLSAQSSVKFDPTKFKRPLKAGAIAGIGLIIHDPRALLLTKEQLAYVLGTVYWETAQWMQPIREGASRFGPDYTNEQAVRAVTAIYNKGVIRTNYARPHPITKQSYYGRGLCQITWYENYVKFGEVTGADLVNNPDLALTWPISLDILYEGMMKGLFRQGKTLRLIVATDDITDTADEVSARDIINGDKRTNGLSIAQISQAFYAALS